jgi:hypothetical protein
MYIFDTDHLSVLDRGGVAAQPLLQRLANIKIYPRPIFLRKTKETGFLAESFRYNEVFS